MTDIPYQLHHGNCLELMADIPDNSVDMVLCDLPYGTTACKWDTVIPFEPLWAAYRRVCKKNAAIVLTASQPFTSALVMSNPGWFKYEFAWDKKHPKGHLNAKKQPLRRHESVLVFCEGQTTYNPQMSTGKMKAKGNVKGSKGSNKGCYGDYGAAGLVVNDQYYPTSILEFSMGDLSKVVHPTQKPVALMDYLIRTYTNEGETVLDNTMGSGTTGVACMNTGRKFIGIEQELKYFEISKSRIHDAYVIS